MTEPAKYDPRRTPSIRWDKRDWPIPPLVADQLDVIWDDVKTLTAVLEAQALAQADADDGKSGADRLAQQIADRVFQLSGSDYKMMREVVYYGLTRAHPALTPQEFRSTPTTPYEMLIAFYIVRRQSGMYGAAVEGDPGAGEAEAIKDDRTSSSS